MRDGWRRLGWLPVTSLLVIVFGIGIAPLLLVLALDGAVGMAILRTLAAARRPAAAPGGAAGRRAIPFHPA